MQTKTKLIISAVGGAVIALGAVAFAQTTALSPSAGAQMGAAPQTAVAPQVTMPGEVTCSSQHQEQPGITTADLLSDSYEIKAAVPGGVWLQKKKDVFYCNAGVTRDDETMCWKIRAPVKGQNCNEALSKARAKDLR
ncbi:hypothetical protein [uncultured Reyranella sp.]|jgi:hypothetical protein|uniref:hypothetical protein n=1 Tax=uncultured Reyranella sp. TaxID=735512 RepID=UPI00259CD31A|nr:hypothetical protein [uncultured Reyranella sp.]